MTSFSNSWTRRTKFTQGSRTAPRPIEFIPQRGLELAQFGARPAAGIGLNFDADLLKVADRIILSTYAPAAVVVDDKMQVHQFRGRTDLFLEHMPGPATFNLIQLARTNLVPDLRATIRRSIKTGKPVAQSARKLRFGEKTTR
jgi:hypothetical protein